MRLETVEINNYRQYKKSTFNFYKNGDFDLHVILGENGTGKTNLLNAISWCLYGQENHLGDRDRAARIFNSEVFEELRKNGIDKGEVKIVVKLESNGNQVSFIRSMGYIISNNFPLPSELKVLELTKGNTDWQAYTNEEDTILLVNKYAPQNIRNYIFFDGELMENYFTQEESKKIKDSILNFSQVSLLYNAIDHLKDFLKEDNRKVADINPDMQNIFNEQKEIETKIDSTQKIISLLESEKNKSEIEIEKYNKIINNAENLPEKECQLIDLSNELFLYENKEKENQIEIFKLVRDYYPLFSAYKYLRTYHDLIIKKESNGELPPKIDFNFVNNMLQVGRCGVCNSDLNQEGINHINNILTQLSVSSELSHFLTRENSSIKQIKKELLKYKEKRDRIINEKKDIVIRIDKINNDLDNLNRFLDLYNNKSEIIEAHKKRQDFRFAHEDQIKQIVLEKEHLKSLQNDNKEINKKINDALIRKEGIDCLKSRISFIQNNISILCEVGKEILEECRNDLEDYTFEWFNDLLWKKDMFKSIKIGEDFTFNLYDIYNEQCIGSCSAAERALLAISFTLGLQKASGHESLLFIDTPIGRVDVNNRVNFINVLIEIAKQKQVILTFTSSELTEDIRNVLSGKESTNHEIKLLNKIVNITHPQYVK